ncbi:FAD-dependent oxidoreductase [Chelatococcus sp. SYSU_G07232]|uniref:FAD-dependent oxidoreductase n=1 Tax=Chelatococcus albus TaxID=3047466 RepID=A0ABT7AH31_9HYPH|nr:FAD-dependent oxidoreductase [Chelatococcus sp. SYSU_G07232]MDJ1158691.1 FAD-dependent oxidoreductase [Chelatococcus sp. SYSU_G07232]
MIERLVTPVAIVGGGIVGASAALALRRMGLAVVLLERDFCGSRSSGVNYGGVRRQGRPMAQLPLAERAHRIWARLPELIGIDGEYVRSGHLKLARSEEDLASLEAYRERAREHGLDLEIVAGHAFRARYPWLGQRALAGSLSPEDGHANPRLVSPAFARAAARLGADVREQTRVDEVAHDGRDFVLRCGDRLEVRARFLLNCAGAWAGAIAERFGEPVPMTSGHPNMAVTEPLPLFMDVNIGVEGGGIYGRQVARGNCVIGGGQGYGLDAERARPAREAIFALLVQAAELFPELRHAHVIRSWSGTEGYLPDRDPVIGFSTTTPGLVHAFGFAGAGFQIGPAVGEVLAELVRDGATPTPIAAFSITRFTGAERAAQPAAAAPR